MITPPKKGKTQKQLVLFGCVFSVCVFLVDCFVCCVCVFVCLLFSVFVCEGCCGWLWERNSTKYYTRKSYNQEDKHKKGTHVFVVCSRLFVLLNCFVCLFCLMYVVCLFVCFWCLCVRVVWDDGERVNTIQACTRRTLKKKKTRATTTQTTNNTQTNTQ